MKRDITKEKRIGFIDLSYEVVVDFWKNNQHLVPIKCEMQEYARTIRYLCYCDGFRELDEGSKIPIYTLDFNRINLYNGEEMIVLTNVEEVKGI